MATQLTCTDKMKVEEYCRTCYLKETQLSSVFEIYLNDISFDIIIMDITEVKITADSCLPTMICQDCKCKAISAFEFKKRTKHVDLFLQTSVKKIEKDMKLKQQPTNDLSDTDLTLLLPMGDNEIEKIKHEMVEEKNDTTFKYETDDSMPSNCFEFNSEPINEDCCNSKKSTPKRRITKKKNINNKSMSLNSTKSNLPRATSYSCTFCKQNFKSKTILKEHIILDHKDTKVLHCMLCKKLFLQSIGFEHDCPFKKKNFNETTVYNETTVAELPLQSILETIPTLENLEVIEACCLCSELFLSEEDHKKHNDIQHPEVSQRCVHCQKVFATIKTAARHRKNCKQMDKKFSCKTCGEKFAFEISLNKHILRYHEGQSVSVKFMDTTSKLEKQYQCDSCSKSFNSKDLLVKHTKIHMPNQKTYECDICKKRFNRKDNLRSHKRVHEVQTEKSTSSNCLCLYCGRSFTNSSNLIVHMRRHTGEKPYKCDFCGKGFPRSSDLKWHRVSHTGEKPCVCRVCSKRFSRSNKLARHMRIHTGHKPYKCTYCDKAFAQSYDLTLHIRRHTGDKPYICEVCGDRFIQGNALQNHRRVHGHFPPTGNQELADSVTNEISQNNEVTYTVHSITH